MRLAEAERIQEKYRFAVFLTDDRHDPRTKAEDDVTGFTKGNLVQLSVVEIFNAFEQALSERTASPLLINLLSCYRNAIEQLRRL